MSLWNDFIELGRQQLPLLIAIATVALALAATHYVLNRRLRGYSHGSFRIQVALLILTLVGVLVIILVLTRNDPEMRGQLLGFLGILLSAAIALSSTTFLGNALAGILLRVVAGFRIGDFIAVGDDFGRVSERSLLHTEIQTEDRDLTTLPNLYLVTNPVRVVRSSGTIVSATVSLGYDVSHQQVEEALTDAAGRIGLEEAFVHVLELGDFSVTYRISGLLTEVKRLLSTRSRLRTAMLDALHERSIEIVSPTFMSTRSLAPGQDVLPPTSSSERPEGPAESSKAETVIFDKAEEAEQLSDLIDRRKRLGEEIDAMRKEAENLADGPDRQRLERRIETLGAAHDDIGDVIERAQARIASD